jgi:hypothetical protein
MTLLPSQWETAMREAREALCDILRKVEGKPERGKAWVAAEKLTAALSDQGTIDTVNALVSVRLAVEQAYKDLVLVSACVAGKLDTLEETPGELLGEHVHGIRHGLEHVRDAAGLLLKALAVDEGPGREVSENHRYLRTLLAGLLAKDKGDFSLRDAGRELGELHHQMRERIRLAERASVYLEWLKTLCGLILDRFPMSTEEAWARANLYAQAARGYLDGRHPPPECLDHPYMKDPRQATAEATNPTEGK